MKLIGHIATPYELEAIDRLKAIVMPLVPEPTWNNIKNCWEWKVPGKGMTIGWFPHFSMQVDGFPYQLGDRVYFEKEWSRETDMLPELGQRWFEVTGVQVLQAKYVPYECMCKAGAYLNRSSIVDPWREMQVKWNTAYPDQQWCLDRWVIILDVRSVF